MMESKRVLLISFPCANRFRSGSDCVSQNRNFTRSERRLKTITQLYQEIRVLIKIPQRMVPFSGHNCKSLAKQGFLREVIDKHELESSRHISTSSRDVQLLIRKLLKSKFDVFHHRSKCSAYVSTKHTLFGNTILLHVPFRMSAGFVRLVTFPGKDVPHRLKVVVVRSGHI